MGEQKAPIFVKLFVGMLAPEVGLFEICADLLCAEYGPIDYQSEIFPWDVSDYYQDEMGRGIFRKFIFFKELVDPSMLSGVKLLTNRMEAQFSVTCGSAVRRRINLDPGYVTEAKIVLASTKDYSHRIYLAQGIYAEITLNYKNMKKSFLPLEHTYPDFRTAEVLSLFNNARGILRTALRRNGLPTKP